MLEREREIEGEIEEERERRERGGESKCEYDGRRRRPA